MNPDTGAIARFETLADAEAAGFAEPLTERQAKRLTPLSREERKKWLTKKKRHRAKSTKFRRARADK